jgi:hypothetical protein
MPSASQRFKPPNPASPLTNTASLVASTILRLANASTFPGGGDFVLLAMFGVK